VCPKFKILKGRYVHNLFGNPSTVPLFPVILRIKRRFFDNRDEYDAMAKRCVFM